VTKRPHPPVDDMDGTDSKQLRLVGSSPPTTDMNSSHIGMSVMKQHRNHVQETSMGQNNPNAAHTDLIRPGSNSSINKEAAPTSDIRLKKEHLLAAATRSVPDPLLTGKSGNTYCSLS
jgi:hypothetical protein